MATPSIRALVLVKSQGWRQSLAFLCRHTCAPTPVARLQEQIKSVLSEIGVRSGDASVAPADVLEARGRLMKVETGGGLNLRQPSALLPLLRDAAQKECECATVRFFFLDVPLDSDGALLTCESSAALLQFQDGATVELVLRYRRWGPDGWNEGDASEAGVPESHAHVLWPRDVTPDYHPHHLCLRVAGHTLQHKRVVRVQGRHVLFGNTEIDMQSLTAEQHTYCHLLEGERPFHARLGVPHRLLDNYDDSLGTDNLYTLLRYSGYVPWGSNEANRAMESLIEHLQDKEQDGEMSQVDLTILAWTEESCDSFLAAQARELDEESGDGSLDDSDDEWGWSDSPRIIEEEEAQRIGRLCSLTPVVPPELIRIEEGHASQPGTRT